MNSTAHPLIQQGRATTESHPYVPPLTSPRASTGAPQYSPHVSSRSQLYSYSQDQPSGPHSQFSGSGVPPRTGTGDQPSAHFNKGHPGPADRTPHHPYHPRYSQREMSNYQQQSAGPDALAALPQQYDQVDAAQGNRTSGNTVYAPAIRGLPGVSSEVSAYSTPSPPSDASRQPTYDTHTNNRQIGSRHFYQSSTAGAFVPNEAVPSQSMPAARPASANVQHSSSLNQGYSGQHYPPVTDTYKLSYNLTATSNQNISSLGYEPHSRPVEASSIPMSNSSGWSQSSLSSALELRPPSHDPTPTRETSRSPALTVSECDSRSASIAALSKSTSVSRAPSVQPPVAVKKKKKSKMHGCDVCGKQFPRPSGLQTHMNIHNNLKPYSCEFPGCSRTFAVRSNAKRHLRTHGVIPTPASDSPAPVPYIVDFSAPTVIHSSASQGEPKAPLKLRWMPPSLTSRTNVQKLRSISDEDSGSEDDDESDADARSALSIPLGAVVPSSQTADFPHRYEERNSYLEVGSHPYHPSQFRGLPGPAAVPLAPRLFGQA